MISVSPRRKPCIGQYASPGICFLCYNRKGFGDLSNPFFLYFGSTDLSLKSHILYNCFWSSTLAVIASHAILFTETSGCWCLFITVTFLGVWAQMPCTTEPCKVKNHCQFACVSANAVQCKARIACILLLFSSFVPFRIHSLDFLWGTNLPLVDKLYLKTLNLSG